MVPPAVSAASPSVATVPWRAGPPQSPGCTLSSWPAPWFGGLMDGPGAWSWGRLMFSKASLRLSLHISMHNNLPCVCCLTQSPGNIYSFHSVSRSAASQMRPPLPVLCLWAERGAGEPAPWGKGVSLGCPGVFFHSPNPYGISLAVFIVLCWLQSDFGLTGPLNV